MQTNPLFLENSPQVFCEQIGADLASNLPHRKWLFSSPCFLNFDSTTESDEKVSSKDYNEILDQSAHVRQALIDIQMDK